MRIYTRTGDKGETSLSGGKRVRKDHLRVITYGEVDELNAAIGVAIGFLEQDPSPESREIPDLLRTIQDHLFTLGADLAAPQELPGKKEPPRISSDHVQKLERWIDRHQEGLPPLKSFILPGGEREGAFLHLARSVCRRAERSLTTLIAQEPTNPEALRYLNRLSDLLFVLARTVNQSGGKTEIPPQYL